MTLANYVMAFHVLLALINKFEIPVFFYVNTMYTSVISFKILYEIFVIPITVLLG
jgi:hypothetical protein